MDLTREEILAAREECGGRLDAMVDYIVDSLRLFCAQTLDGVAR